MKKNIAKIAAVLLSTTLCTSMLAGCGNSGSNESTSQPSESKSEAAGSSTGESAANESKETEPAEPIPLTVWAPDSIRIEDWNTNFMTLWMEEQLNVDITVVTLPSDEYASKINISLTAGSVDELPDIIVGSSSHFKDAAIWSWAQAETIIPLTDYYNDPELSVNLREAFERVGKDYTKQITSPDGNIYGIASMNLSYGNEYAHKLWIYKPWLDALGKEVPTTTDEFYELLKLVSQTDLNGNGKADEIGMAGTKIGSTYDCYLPLLMNAFVYAGDSNYRVVEDGVVSVAYTTEEWKEGLKYIAKLFSENLIMAESLSMENEQFGSLMNSEDPQVFSYSYLTCGMVTSGSQRSYEYVCIDTLTGPNGVNYATYRPAVPNVTFLVTANCKNPEAAFKLGDLMSSEYIGITQRWGQEGVNWDYADNVDDLSKYTEPLAGFEPSIIIYDDAHFWSGKEVANASWRQAGPYVRGYSLLCGVINPLEEGGANPYVENLNNAWTLYQTSGHQPKELIRKVVLTEEEASVANEVESNLKTYVNECMGHFVNGDWDIDAKWDEYLNELNKIGLEEYLKIEQAAYDRMK